jgi:hypothetical protein
MVMRRRDIAVPAETPSHSADLRLMLEEFLLDRVADGARKTLGLEQFAQRLGGGFFVVGGEAAGDAAGGASLQGGGSKKFPSSPK